MDETALPLYFGEWLKCRRKELDLTQSELAQLTGCSVPALRKIEAGERRPSKQLAGLLAKSLEIPPDEQSLFVRVARGELNLDRLYSPWRAPSKLYKPAPLPSPPPGNLPQMLTPFVGREPELAALSQLLHDPLCRLLTITGPGGIGKTRLALEIASRHKDLFPDGIWFVPLAPLNSADYLVSAISDALNFWCHGLADACGNLLNHLGEKSTLLILDNTEHLLAGVGLYTEILEHCPRVKLLVTSRERLDLHSEWMFEIQGLPVPPSDRVEQMDEYSSARLFLQRVRQVRSGYDLPDAERSWVVRICQIMEGMPLGLELAAAWAGLLSLEEIAKESENSLDFLTVSMRDLPERHRSLRGMIAHSWDLLDDKERLLLSRLSVFRGSFSRLAAEEVCITHIQALLALKNKSLLRRTESDRFELHELIRQFAALKLAENPDEEELAQVRHAFYYARLLTDWEKALKCSRQVDALTEMVHEIANLRQAWQYMVACCDQDTTQNLLFPPSLFQSSLFSLSLFLEMRCRNQEAITLLGESMRVLKAGRAARKTANQVWRFEPVLGMITAYLGLHHAIIQQFSRAVEYLEDAISLLQADESKVEKAQAQLMLAWVLATQGKIENASVLYEETRTVFQAENNDWWYLLATSQLAAVYLSAGRVEESEALCQEGSRLLKTGDLRIGIPLRNSMAQLLAMHRRYDEAQRLLEDNIKLSYQLGSKRQTAVCYLNLGQVALAAGWIELAELNFQEAVNILSEFGDSHFLAIALVYSGKGFVARQEWEAARGIFQRVIHMGRSLSIFYLAYWGLVNLVRVNLCAGQSERVLEMAVVLERYAVELKVAQDDGISLLRDVQAGLAPGLYEAARERMRGRTLESLPGYIEASPPFITGQVLSPS